MKSVYQAVRNSRTRITLRFILNVLAETVPGYRTVDAISGTWKWHQKILFKTKNNLDIWCTLVTSFSIWGNSPTRAHDASLLRFLDHTHTHKPGRTPLEEWSAHHRSCYLHNTHKRPKSMPSAGFEPTIPAIKRLQTTRPPG